MRFLERMWKDVRNGENIETYAMIVVGFIFTIYNFISPVTQFYSWIMSVLSFVFVLFVSSILNVRHKLAEIQSDFALGKQNVMLDNFPLDVWTERVPEATDVWMVGVSLHFIVKEFYALLQTKLRNGCTIKILLSDPTEEMCQIISRQKYAPTTPGQVKAQIDMTLARLCELQKSAPERLQIRVLNYPLPYNIGAVDPEKPTGGVFIENRPYKMPRENFPKFVLNVSDGNLYEFYKIQLFTLWENGRPWHGDNQNK